MDPATASTAPPVELDPPDRTKKLKGSHHTPSPPPQEGHKNLTIQTPVIPTTDRLGEDDLSLIFSNSSISPEDLLHFRLVNKNWRNAASSALLQRDACSIALENKSSILCKRGDETRTLSQLTQLMSNSSKFPVSTLHLLLDEYCPRDDYSSHSDLLEFFQLHGAKVMGLVLVGSLALEPLLNFLSSYTLVLERLDLKSVHFFNLKPIVEGQNWTSKLMPTVKMLTISSHGDQYNSQVMHRLLASFPNLISIENVNRGTLPHILKEGKGHLIRTFDRTLFTGDHDPTTNTETITETEAYVSLLQKFAGVRPQLFKIKFDLDDSCVPILSSMNALLESSKDTLQQLELAISQIEHQSKLKIVPMKNLKSIVLSGKYLLDGTDEDHMADVNTNEAYSIFESGMSAAQTFPGLAKLRLNFLNVEIDIVRFFQFKLGLDLTTSPTKNCLPNVRVLELHDSSLLTQNPDSCLSISKFFPNLQRLNFHCQDFKDNFDSSLWLLFPTVEFLEIYDISSDRVDQGVSTIADRFFTGFSARMCKKLRTTDIPEFKNETEGIQFLRYTPSVCDMLHLKELKLAFSELWVEFASRVTGLYAFSHMPNTKFIISYDPNKFSDGRGEFIAEDIDHSELCFGSIKPYVQIVHEKIMEE